ncbi:hypothetical protein HK098_005087, partial [Nowakowskiella sp. JEL0407]
MLFTHQTTSTVDLLSVNPSAVPSSIVASVLLDNSLYALISFDSLYIFDFVNNECLAFVTRSTQTIHDDGKNIFVFSSKNLILVVTDSGFIHYYVLSHSPSQKAFAYSFYNGNSSTNYSIISSSSGSYSLKFMLALEIDTGIQCGIALTSEILLFTKDSPSILSLSHDGQVNLSKTISLSDLSFIIDPTDVITKIDYLRPSPSPNSATVSPLLSSDLLLFAWITLSGCAYLALRSSSTATPTNTCEWSGICFYNPELTSKLATSISLSKKRIAIGLSTGSCLVYFFSEDYTKIYYSHEISLWDEKLLYFPKLGPVLKLAWSNPPESADCLAVAWDCGLAIWSWSGKLLNKFLAEDIEEEDEEGYGLADDYYYGVLDFFWSPASYSLYILPMSTTQTPTPKIHIMPFLKSIISTNSSQYNIKSGGCLISEEQVWMYQGSDERFDVMNLDLVQWDIVQIPNMYLSQNWPITVASIDETGNFLAISGKRGFCHYSKISKRWKLFGNEQQELNFVVDGGIVWFHGIIIVSCFDFVNLEYQIRLYPRDANLDHRNIIHTEVLTKPVLKMDILNENLLILGDDNIIRWYSIYGEGNNLKMQLHLQISLSGVVLNPQFVECIAWYPPIGKVTHESMKNTMILILKAGEVSVLRVLNNEGWEHIHLTSKIEYFSVLPQLASGSSATSLVTMKPESGLYNSLWAVGESGIKVWTNLQVPSGVKWYEELPHVEPLDIKIESYPLTVILEKGIIMGLESLTSLRNSLNCPMFKLEIKIDLFLHYILRYLLSKSLTVESSNFAKSFSNLEYFGHVLEILLHSVLEDEVDRTPIGVIPPTPESSHLLDEESKFDETTATAGTATTNGVGVLELSTVLKFLKQFPNYLDVVAQCARKSEVLVWKYFFDVVGDVKDLFMKCLELGALATATSYLIIIQTLESPSVSGYMAVLLLERSFELEDFETGGNLIKFLSSIQDEQVPFEPVETKQDSDEEKESSNDTFTIKLANDIRPELGYVPVIITKHAKILFQKYRILSLYHFSRIVNFSLSEFLENQRTCEFNFDWKVAFKVIHEQFGWEYPADISSFSKFSSDFVSPTSTINSASSTNLQQYTRRRDSNGEQYGPSMMAQTQQQKGKKKHVGLQREIGMKKVEDIKYLITAFQNSGWTEWTLVLATMICDIKLILEVLSNNDENGKLESDWKTMIMDCQG